MRLKRLWPQLLGLAFCTVVGIYLFSLVDYQPSRLIELKSEITPLTFVIAMSLAPAFGFSIALFYLLAGVTFNFWLGWGLCLLSLFVNMTVGYVMARYCFRELIVKVLRRRQFKLPEISELNQFRITFLIRALPGVPFTLQNWILGILNVPYLLYIIVSLATQGLIAAIVVKSGGLLPDDLGVEHLYIGLSLIALVIVLRGLYYLFCRRRTNAISAKETCDGRKSI